MLGPSPANVRRKKPNSRSDLSLLRSDDFFRATATGSMLPAYRFEILLNQFPARSAYRSHPQPLSRSGDDQRASPVAGSFAQHSRSSSGPPLPSGLYALGIEALDPTPTRRSALAIRPISVRSPRGLAFYFATTRITVPGPLRLAGLAVPCNL